MSHTAAFPPQSLNPTLEQLLRGTASHGQHMALQVTHGRQHGVIYVHEGRVQHAQVDGLDPVGALRRLLASRGDWIVVEPVICIPTIDVSIQEVVNSFPELPSTLQVLDDALEDEVLEVQLGSVLPTDVALTHIGDNGQHCRRILMGGQSLLGRDGDNDLPIDDHSVSGLHAKVVRTAEGMFIEDLGSTNGTIVNGWKIDAAVIKDGDVIQLGSYVLHVEERTRASGAAREDTAPITPRRRAAELAHA